MTPHFVSVPFIQNGKAEYSHNTPTLSRLYKKRDREGERERVHK